MKRILGLLALLAFAPSFVMAQSPPPGPTSQQMQAMHQMMQQQMTMHKQFRDTVLNALTPEHRSLLQSIVGQLMLSDQPDMQAAAQQLDAALSPAERDAILSANTSFMAQMRTFHQQMMAQFQKNHPNMPKPQMRNPNGQPPAPDAGRIVLMATMMRAMGMGMGMGMMHMHMGRPMPSPSPGA